MDRIGANQDGLWDDEDGFFYDMYDAFYLPGGSAARLKVWSMVGLPPVTRNTRGLKIEVVVVKRKLTTTPK
jgi:hypothetical protein